MLDICKKFELFGKGFGHETRFKILIALFEKERSVNELAAILQLSQPLVSQHLKILKEGGLVVGAKSGKEVYYHIDRENVIHLLKYMLRAVSHLPRKQCPRGKVCPPLTLFRGIIKSKLL